MTKPVLDPNDIPSETGSERPNGPEEDLAPNLTLGPWEGKSLGDAFGLTHFGVALETLPPGSKSSMRHWHSKSDEFVMVQDGEFVLVTDEGETCMTAGMVAGFKSGAENGHHLINRSDKPATFLVVGSRLPGDAVHYPDDDFQWLAQDDGTRVAARKDGTEY